MPEVDIARGFNSRQGLEVTLVVQCVVSVSACAVTGVRDLQTMVSGFASRLTTQRNA